MFQISKSNKAKRLYFYIFKYCKNIRKVSNNVGYAHFRTNITHRVCVIAKKLIYYLLIEYLFDTHDLRGLTFFAELSLFARSHNIPIPYRQIAIEREKTKMMMRHLNLKLHATLF